ncbi:MAG: O-methyltransferase [Sphingobacteriales bacterium]|nr:MAG: O-methyltransferase [Sphingobacteriales bacterium]
MTKLLLSKALNDYAEAYSTPESTVLAKLNRETNMKVQQSQMLSGHLQGAFLSMISHMLKPKNVLELGTYTGYSAICLAQGITAGGQLHTIDINEELKDMSFRYFCEAGLEGTIIQHIGKAADIIPGLDMEFDLVFIDADKQNYPLYYNLVFDKIPVGGYILADNVLFEGDVLLPENEQSKNAKAMNAFNQKIKADDRIEQVILPLRDGLTLIRKIKN